MKRGNGNGPALDLGDDPELAAMWGGPDALAREIEILHRVALELEPLSPGARVRVLWWCLWKYCPHVPQPWIDKIMTWGLPEDDKTR